MDKLQSAWEKVQGVAQGFTFTPENVFLVLASVFGLIFVFVTPPMQSPDEVEHLFRSYQVSQFNIKADPVDNGYGGTLPVSLETSVKKLKDSAAGQVNKHFDTQLFGETFHTPLSPKYEQPIRFDNTAIYSPVPYLPQAVGVGVARTLHLNPLLIIYFGRLTNLICWIILIYIAIRLAPFGKWAFAAIALNPLSLFLSSTLSSDAASIGLVAVFVALVLRMRHEATALSGKQIALLTALVIGVCLTKNAYLPLALLVFLLPQRSLGLYKRAAIVAAGLLVGLLWNIVILQVAQGIPGYFGIATTVNSSQQVDAIKHAPLGFVHTLISNAIGQPSSGILPSYDGTFGWADTPNPYWVSVVFYTVLLLAFFYRDESKRVLREIDWRVRALPLGIFLAGSLALFVSLYVGYSKVGSTIIDGIQGRYFIPLTFLFIPVLATNKISISMSKRLHAYLTTGLLCLVMVATLVTLVTRYY